MIGRQKEVPQAIRLLYLLLYLAFLILINRLAFDQWFPLTTPKGLWFYSGTGALILGSLLVTPFYTTPANAIAYLVAAFIAVMVYAAPTTDLIDTLPRNIVIGFCCLMLIVCVLTILYKDSTHRWRHNISQAGRMLADNIGSPRFVYSVVVMYALWEYHRDAPMELFFVGASGIVIAAQRPLEVFGSMLQNIAQVWRPDQAPLILGNVVAHQTPGLLLIRQQSEGAPDLNSCLLVADEHGPLKVAVALGYFGRDEGVLLRALEINVPIAHHSQLTELTKHTPKGSVCILDGKQTETFQDDVYLLKNLESFIGIVATETSTERLYFEVIHERDIEQGRLVETFVGSKRVLYQVLDGLTKEDIIQQKNTFGFARGEAAQVGIWDEEERKFKPCSWIPQLNAPVFLKTIEEHEDNPNAVGHFPMTKYDVEIKSIDELVTHNTAILGILGVGKSMLGIELVERMIARGLKVVCIDLTSQYATELSDFHDAEHEAERLRAIQEAGQQDMNEFAENPSAGGSIESLRQAVYNDLKEFLTEDKTHQLKIYNPAEISATKQEQEPRSYNVGGEWHRSAALWQVTAVEITSMITEACLSLVQDKMSKEARVCLVFEEAHSLVPERNFITADGDQRAASATARAILQGRKYGLGCLLVTQRTANVSKTILNQCNTIFAMRTYDETGKEFLSNFISSKYANRLATLKEREAVFFGRASSCENPVMIRLNDRSDFIRAFKNQQQANTPEAET